MELEEGLLDVFREPEQAEAQLFQENLAEYKIESISKTLRCRLVTKHVLWAHVLYPSAKCVSRWLEHNASLVKGKSVAELGAAAGLPSLVAASLGAEVVVMTDYPDPHLIDNLTFQIGENNLDPLRVKATSYIWGHSAKPLLDYLPDGRKFDLVILSDLVFNHSQHDALLKSCKDLLSIDGMALCFYAHHRPTEELIKKDRGFVQLAESKGWRCERVMEDTKAGPAFPEDQGDLAIRSTVHGFLLRPP